MNAYGISRFRLEVCSFEWSSQPTSVRPSPLWGGGFAPESASGAVCSLTSAPRHWLKSGSAGRASAAFQGGRGFAFQTDDPGSRRRASGLLCCNGRWRPGCTVCLVRQCLRVALPKAVFRTAEGAHTHPCARVELSPSNGARLPAELKHITKRRKRNQQGCP